MSPTRIAELKAQLQELSLRYYTEGDSPAADAEYDALQAELRALEGAGGWSTTVVGPKPRKGRVAHAAPMYSLDNVYSEAEVASWLESVEGEIAVEWKVDGASVELIYERRADRYWLAEAITRGDGHHGESCLPVARLIAPRHVDAVHFPGAGPKLVIRGEIAVNRKTFATLNEALIAAGQQPFSTARNLAAGSLKLVDAGEIQKRGLVLYAYQWLDATADTHSQVQGSLLAASFDVPRARRRPLVREDVYGQIQALEALREDLVVDVDGVVLKVDRLADHAKLGVVGKYPRWARAFKYPPPKLQTVVENVTYQVGRTGVLTPVAEIDPVILSGTLVSRATLNNQEWLEEHGVGPGTVVVVQKAGEVIPQIVEVVTPAEPATIEQCPRCGTATERDGRRVYCPNLQCAGRVEATLTYFAQRSNMEIQSLGPSTASALVAAGVRDVADLYERADELCPNTANGRRLRLEIERSKSQPFDRLVSALGIEGLGRVLAERFTDVIGSLALLVELPIDAVIRKVTGLPGFGAVVLADVRTFLANNLGLLQRLRAAEVSQAVEVEEAENDHAKGLSFCVTGTLSIERDEVHARIRKAGGTVHTSVRKGTTYLVVGAKVGATKVAAAKAKGTKVIEEVTLEQILRGSNGP